MKTIRTSVWDEKGNVIHNIPMRAMTDEDFLIIKNFCEQQIDVNRALLAQLESMAKITDLLKTQNTLLLERIEMIDRRTHNPILRG